MKTTFKCTAWVTLFTLLVAFAIAWTAAGRLLNPERRALAAYQQEWLAHSSRHGMRVAVARCAGGNVPCLFVSPDPKAGPKERGMELRSQLESRASLSLRPYGDTQGILVLLHGRGGRKEGLLPVAERFAAAGFKCVIPDLPAHGDSPIKGAHFATTKLERDIATDVLADARRYFHERNAPAGIWGVSMGGAFVMRALSQSPSTWKAAVIVSSFDSLEGVVEDRLAFLPRPVSLLLDRSLDLSMRERGGLALQDVRPDVWARKVTTPVLVVHGDRDEVVAIERGRHLFDALPVHDKSWLVVRGANHGNVLIRATLYAAMSEWLIDHLR